MNIKVNNSNFDLRQTFLCGQCFRWKENDNGGFSGIAMGRRLTLSELNGEIIIEGVQKEDIPKWRGYFDLDTDYSEYIRLFSADKTLKAACEGSPGIRILRQEPFETLISFIISQNNNIPRISGIIGRLCESFGEDIGGGDFAFPTAEKLRGIEPEDLAPLRAGFRAKYIVGEVNRDCVLLFAFHKLDAFPKDVWVKRLMAEFYPDGLPECTKGAEGVAQQYLFDYVRNNDGLQV